MQRGVAVGIARIHVGLQREQRLGGGEILAGEREEQRGLAAGVGGVDVCADFREGQDEVETIAVRGDDERRLAELVQHVGRGIMRGNFRDQRDVARGGGGVERRGEARGRPGVPSVPLH